MRVLLTFATALLALSIPKALPLYAQSAAPLTATAYIRERTNATQWFSATPEAERYGHQDSLLRLGIQQRIRRFDYQLELSQSAEMALPTDAVSKIIAQGQLGLGGTYYASNGNNQYPAAASFKTGFLRYHFGGESDALRVGRFEFFDGQEMAPSDPTLAWLQTNRVAQRMIGNFGFANAQRSYDGIDAKLGGAKWNLTAIAARATQGVFNMNSNPELNVDIQYLAYTRALPQMHTLVRGFAMGYHDGRTGIVKTDNRALTVRQTDRGNIRIGSYGADVISAIPAAGNTVDFLFWGVLQNGKWGNLQQRSAAFAVEGGLKLNTLRTRPWLRAGVLRTTGDNNPHDNVHNTFFQGLPTPRVYARDPFYNLMNSSDQFIQLIDKPTAKLDLRTDLHFLQLTAANDLWYQGGGAFDSKVFGYIGRPSSGLSSFASVYDVSADYAINKQLSLAFYYAHVFGKSVVSSIYKPERDSNYGYFELTYRMSKQLNHLAPHS